MLHNFMLFCITLLFLSPLLNKPTETFFCFKEYCDFKDSLMIPAENNTIKAIIFDLNGVIFKTKKKTYLRAIPYLFKYALLRLWKKESFSIEKFFDSAIQDMPATFSTNPETIAYNHNQPIAPILNDWQCGIDIYSRVIKHIEAKKIATSDKKFLKAIAQLLLDPEFFAHSKTPINHSIQMLKDLKDAGYKIYVLSNWDAQSFPIFMQKNIDIMHLFDGIMISGDEKLVKPDVFFYKKCLEKFNLQADESLFIDDQIINVQGAHKAGMPAFLFNYKDKAGIIQQFQKYNIIKK
jgi:HAD superfamily hydrolase (TIGR01509 family)